MLASGNYVILGLCALASIGLIIWGSINLINAKKKARSKNVFYREIAGFSIGALGLIITLIIAFLDNSAINNYYFNYKQSEASENELLYNAQIVYDSGDYELFFSLYTDERLASNDIANTNLGYMYANGIYVKKDIGLAEYYYNKAIVNNYHPAYSNKLAMYFNNPDECFEKIAPLIVESNNADIDNVAIFIGSYISKSSDIQKCKDDLEEFYSYSKDEQENFLYEKMFEWSYIDTIRSSSVMTNSQFAKYKEIDVYYDLVPYEDEKSELGLVLYIRYEMWHKIPFNIQLLHEEFIRI